MTDPRNSLGLANPPATQEDPESALGSLYPNAMEPPDPLSVLVLGLIGDWSFDINGVLWT